MIRDGLLATKPDLDSSRILMMMMMIHKIQFSWNHPSDHKQGTSNSRVNSETGSETSHRRSSIGQYPMHVGTLSAGKGRDHDGTVPRLEAP